MTVWKFFLMLLVFLLPGGSLVLLALATAKALGANKVLPLGRTPQPVPVKVGVGGVGDIAREA